MPIHPPVKTRFREAELVESIASDSPYRVDREQGIIHDVKVIGRYSPNAHKEPGVTRGTEYTEQALKRAIPLYEGRPVNSDHPPRSKPDTERSTNDRLGRLVNVRFKDDGLYADLHLLKTHPMADRLMEAAERMPEVFGLSHNAKGRGHVVNGRYTIVEIPLVRSVDVVADAATNKSLFESVEKLNMAGNKKTLREILESRRNVETKKRFSNLLEDDAYGSTMMEDPMPPPPSDAAGGAPPLPEDEPGHLDHLGELVKAILTDESLSDAQKVEKAKHAIDTVTKGDEPEEEEAPGESESETEEEVEGDDAKKKKEDKDKMESLERENKTLKREKGVRDLCESKDFAPSKHQLKALVALDSDGDRRTLIDDFKKIPSTAKKGTTAPRTPTSTRATLEGRGGDPVEYPKGDKLADRLKQLQ